MVTIVGHGGQCCGVRHINGFGGFHIVSDYERRTFGESIRACPDRRLAEVILNEEQMMPARLRMLKEAGFTFVCQFGNGNSTNQCYIFHRYAGGTVRKYKYRTDPPAKWTAIEVDQVPQA